MTTLSKDKAGIFTKMRERSDNKPVRFAFIIAQNVDVTNQLLQRDKCFHGFEYGAYATTSFYSAVFNKQRISSHHKYVYFHKDAITVLSQ